MRLLVAIDEPGAPHEEGYVTLYPAALRGVGVLIPEALCALARVEQNTSQVDYVVAGDTSAARRWLDSLQPTIVREQFHCYAMQAP